VFFVVANFPFTLLKWIAGLVLLAIVVAFFALASQGGNGNIIYMRACSSAGMSNGLLIITGI